MTNWLDPVRGVLDDLPHPAVFFFRDDDAGWEDQRLFHLLDTFAAHNLPIDLAVIPVALTSETGRELLRRMEAAPDRVRVHQHGYAHTNHEPQGRKCEFGPSRDRAAQQSDIEQGRRRLQKVFGPHIDPIFTPPWNRCTAATGQCLAELGFAVLSREAGAAPLSEPGLTELFITHDWFAHRKGVRLTREEWGRKLATEIRVGTRTGIMLHHAVTDRNELRDIADLAALLASHPWAQCETMNSIALGAQHAHLCRIMPR